jgi:hypothetical protein
MTETELESRVLWLERRCRALLLALAVVGTTLVAAVLWILLRTPGVISAERFVLKDRHGEMRGEWGPSWRISGEVDGKPTQSSTTCLNLRNPHGAALLACTPWEGPGPSMLFLQSERGAKVLLSADAFQATSRLEARKPGAEAASAIADSSVSHVGGWSRLRDNARGTVLVEPEGLSISDGRGQVVARLPAANVSKRDPPAR